MDRQGPKWHKETKMEIMILGAIFALAVAIRAFAAKRGRQQEYQGIMAARLRRYAGCSTQKTWHRQTQIG